MMPETCRKTDDGSTYPLDFAWGNTGTIMNGVCLSAIYQKLAIVSYSSEESKDRRCFMHRKIGYFFNHKFDTKGSLCNTHGEEGFPYMVECAFWPYFSSKILVRAQNFREKNTFRVFQSMLSAFSLLCDMKVDSALCMQGRQLLPNSPPQPRCSLP